MKKNILVIYGGISCEHDISIITAVEAMNNLNKNKYEIIPAYIREEKIYTGNKLLQMDAYKNFNSKKRSLKEIRFTNLGVFKKAFIFNRHIKIDSALNCCHGGLGENGGIQGLLEYYKIPYTSAGIAASSVFWDKILTKQFAISENIPILPFSVIDSSDYSEIKSLEFPLIIKPANQGSSIGVSIAYDMAELQEGVEIAREFSERIVVEKALVNFCDINCAVLKTKDSFLISECEKPIFENDFLSFKDKYVNCPRKNENNDIIGMKNQKREFPALLSKKTKEAIENIVKKVYKKLPDLRGSIRIDFLLNLDNDEIFLNEINTIPGSLAYYLYKTKNLSFSQLLEIMIEVSILDFKKLKKKRYIFPSEILNLTSKS